MKDGVSFDGYIDNPTGGNFISNRTMYKDMYQKKFDALLLREQGSIQFFVYYTNDKRDTHYIHLKIPSESVVGLYYDVVIELSTSDPEKQKMDKLRQYMVRFFSNDAAFTYTFAHTFMQRDMFVKDLRSKMSTIVRRSPASVRNPNNEVFYVKSLYFAYLAMEHYHLFFRPTLELLGKPYSRSKLNATVASFNAKTKEYNELKANKKEAENKQKKNISAAKSSAKQFDQKQKSNTTKVAKAANVAKKTPMTKTTKTINKVKTIGKK